EPAVGVLFDVPQPQAVPTSHRAQSGAETTAVVGVLVVLDGAVVRSVAAVGVLEVTEAAADGLPGTVPRALRQVDDGGAVGLVDVTVDPVHGRHLLMGARSPPSRAEALDPSCPGSPSDQ